MFEQPTLQIVFELLANEPLERAPHYLGLRMDTGLPPNLLPELARRNVYVSVRGSSIRVTPHLYNIEADIDRFIGALAAVLG